MYFRIDRHGESDLFFFCCYSNLSACLSVSLSSVSVCGRRDTASDYRGGPTTANYGWWLGAHRRRTRTKTKTKKNGHGYRHINIDVPQRYRSYVNVKSESNGHTNKQTNMLLSSLMLQRYSLGVCASFSRHWCCCRRRARRLRVTSVVRWPLSRRRPVIGRHRHRRLSDVRRGHKRRRPGPAHRSRRPGSRLRDACHERRRQIGPAAKAVDMTVTAITIAANTADTRWHRRRFGESATLVPRLVDGVRNKVPRHQRPNARPLVGFAQYIVLPSKIFKL